jgi:hypothetical protein
VEIENDELFKMLFWSGNEKGDDKYTSSTVVGAEPVAPLPANSNQQDERG